MADGDCWCRRPELEEGEQPEVVSEYILDDEADEDLWNGDEDEEEEEEGAGEEAGFAFKVDDIEIEEGMMIDEFVDESLLQDLKSQQENQ